MTTPYAHPEVLVETDWVKQNLGKPGIKLVEIDVDTQAYDAGHIPSAVGFNWQTQLQDQLNRDIIGKEAFEKLVGGAGISPRDTVILYGDNNNWFAANAFWLFMVYGHRDVRLMNGGRAKWQREPDKELTTERPNPKAVPYRVAETRPGLRALLPDVLRAVQSRACNLVDVRSTDEYTGKVIAPPGMNESAQRGGHIRGAVGFNWRTELQDQVGRDIIGQEAFERLVGGAGISPRDTVILYGDNHNWFAANSFWLFKLYGHKDVRLMNGGRAKWQREPD